MAGRRTAASGRESSSGHRPAGARGAAGPTHCRTRRRVYDAVSTTSSRSSSMWVGGGARGFTRSSSGAAPSRHRPAGERGTAPVPPWRGPPCTHPASPELAEQLSGSGQRPLGVPELDTSGVPEQRNPVCVEVMDRHQPGVPGAVGLPALKRLTGASGLATERFGDDVTAAMSCTPLHVVIPTELLTPLIPAPPSAGARPP
jgi:hypothetical protein